MSVRESVAASRFRTAAVALAAAIAAGPACYHYRAVPVQPITDDAPGGAPAPATEYQGETVWALAWGLVQERPDIRDCEGQGLAEVRVTTNLGYTLLTLATLGFASPAHVQWRCAKATPQPEPIGSGDAGSRDLFPVSDTPSIEARAAAGVPSGARTPRRSRIPAGRPAR